MRRFSLSLLFTATAFAQPRAQQLYQMNCAACHQLDQMTVGPSMVEMRRLYNGNPRGFIKWCIEPQRKRPGAVEMPSMRHIPEPDLLRIYDYIVSEADGVKEKGTGKDVDLYPQRMNKRPRVQRMFVEESGPASIVVALPATYNFIWDAGQCRLRRVWRGDFMNAYYYFRSNGNAFGYPRSKDFVLEEMASPLGFVTADSTIKFLGYALTDGVPTFRYRVDDVLVEERLSENEGALTRTFTLTGAPASVELTLPEGGAYTSPGNIVKENRIFAKADAPIVIHYNFEK